MDISEKLKKLRIDHGLSQKELAAKLNIAQASISDYERGITSYTDHNSSCLC